ncbi:MAG: glycosyltransferase, partial [Candidatus Omnitrophica bacterium]|nr:glycosyltransferase [Candidatus Omnitrophota bacterium]
QGGGCSLLYMLLGVLPKNLGLTVLLDTRMKVPKGMPEGMQISRIKPSIMQRLKAEWWLARNVRHGDVVLCFGNLPPLFRLRGHTMVFLQNKYLVDRVGLAGFPIKTRLRISVERLWFSWKAAHANKFIVQTSSMKALLESMLGASASVHVVPFVGVSEGYARRLIQHGFQKSGRYDFLYVASGDPHKNHRQLVEAWCLLAAEGLFPSLCLTVSEIVSTELCRWIDEKKNQFGLHLENLGVLSHDQIKHLYSQSQALIYPSTFESFGLPLIEARQAGLAVLAAELDYVRDVLDPEQSFNPESPMSIVRAVKRFMGLKDQPLPLLNAADFIKRILEKCK